MIRLLGILGIILMWTPYFYLCWRMWEMEKRMEVLKRAIECLLKVELEK